MNSTVDLFVHELRDMLNAENKLAKALTEQELESSHPELRQAFERHRRQTQQQAVRLLGIFREIGVTPEQAECKGIQGLIDEKAEFMKKRPSREAIDVFNVVAAIKVERYEISAYESLIRMARQLGLTNATQRLEHSLREEEQTLERMQLFGQRIKLGDSGLRGGQMEGEIPRKAA